LWENDSWILRQDNAPAHNALTVSGQKSNASYKHPPHSPGLGPRDFWLFPKSKSRKIEKAEGKH